MISVATLVMIAWIPVILVSFSLQAPRRAIISAYMVGWMLLPILNWDLPGLPDYNKTTATNIGVFAAVVFFDFQCIARFRPRAVDLPLVLFCACPLGTSLANGLGVYDGLAGVWSQCVQWAIPWIIGRCYFGSLPALRELAIGMFIAALVYLPLCAFEMAFGAILHLKVYGYYQHDPAQTMRADGSVRPMVFMQHGLMLSMWLGSCALVGLAVARTWPPARLSRGSWTALAVALVATTLLSRSIGASVLMLAGIVAWNVVRGMRMLLPVLVVLLAIPVYMSARVTGVLGVVDVTQVLSASLESSGLSAEEITDRLASARVRLDSEDKLFEQVRRMPLFGVSGWRFNEFVDPVTGEIGTVITDGYWTIQCATRGMVGLVAWTALMLLPVLLFVRRHPAAAWRTPLVAIGGALALVLLIYTADCLMNANINPVYTVIAGGLVGFPPLRQARPGAPSVHVGVPKRVTAMDQALRGPVTDGNRSPCCSAPGGSPCVAAAG